jgi:hypothetical protein
LVSSAGSGIVKANDLTTRNVEILASSHFPDSGNVLSGESSSRPLAWLWTDSGAAH